MFKEGFILDKIQEECACNRMWFRRDSIQPSTHTTKVISAVRVKHSPVKKRICRETHSWYAFDWCKLIPTRSSSWILLNLSLLLVSVVLNEGTTRSSFCIKRNSRNSSYPAANEMYWKLRVQWMCPTTRWISIRSSIFEQ